MKKRTRVVLAASIVLAPLTFGIGDQLRMRVMPPDQDEWNDFVVAMLERVAADSGLWTAVSYTLYLALFLGITATIAIWRLSVAHAPRWAWAGAILGGLGVLGEAVHLTAHFATLGAFASYEDRAVAAELYLTLEQHPFAMALFIPFLLGIFALIPQAVGLRRARVIPLWAMLALVGGPVMMMVAGGSTPVASAVFTLLVVIGFTPAALAMLRSPTLAPAHASPPAHEAQALEGLTEPVT
jgi:hypothetical protein